MPAVMPSQVVHFIDTELSYTRSPGQGVLLDPSVCGALNALLRLIDELPNPLLPREPKTYARFIGSVESIRYEVTRAQNQEAREAALMGPPQFTQRGHGDRK